MEVVLCYWQISESHVSEAWYPVSLKFSLFLFPSIMWPVFILQ
jgi:hypothetical protein